MLIVNADDWGRSRAETDAALKCATNRRVSSVSAMVFMADSSRAAELALENQLDVGLHLNFAERFTGVEQSRRLSECQDKLVRFLMRHRYSQLVYNPLLRREFSYVFNAQFDEFLRLYGRQPSHVDGHRHMHLCANLVLDPVIPAGTKMRRNFSFFAGEKSLLNRTYRAAVDRWLARRYRLPDYFFCMSQCIREQRIDRAVSLARTSSVEIMTHPIVAQESEFLLGDEFCSAITSVPLCGYDRL